MEPDRIFGDVAELYDRRRPGYPAAAVEAVLDAAPGAAQAVVETGAGTGKATAEFAARGASVLAIEPDPRMAEICRANTAATGRVEVLVAHLEDAVLEPGGFTIGLAAQSWHWVDPERGAARMAEAIRSGGVLALMWNTAAEDRSPIRLAIEAAYRRHAPELAETSVANRPVTVDGSGHESLVGPGRFDVPTWTAFPWTHRYTSREYVELLATFSDHQLLAPDVRAALLADVRAVIDDHGGSLDYRFVTDLGLLRRR
ncbi:MAG TPA: methyltransferase domain-containing protein [Acidimicrobiia bacterium]|jgi:SAM-dependent methyltransferase